MGVHSYNDLHKHLGHEIECVGYGGFVVTRGGMLRRQPYATIAVECVTCGVVLLDFDRSDLVPVSPE